jgi:hypothetical protein
MIFEISKHKGAVAITYRAKYTEEVDIFKLLIEDIKKHRQVSKK